RTASFGAVQGGDAHQLSHIQHVRHIDRIQQFVISHWILRADLHTWHECVTHLSKTFDRAFNLLSALEVVHLTPHQLADLVLHEGWCDGVARRSSQETIELFLHLEFSGIVYNVRRSARILGRRTSRNFCFPAYSNDSADIVRSQ